MYLSVCFVHLLEVSSSFQPLVVCFVHLSEVSSSQPLGDPGEEEEGGSSTSPKPVPYRNVVFYVLFSKLNQCKKNIFTVLKGQK